MKLGEGLAQILSEDEKMGEGKHKLFIDTTPRTFI